MESITEYHKDRSCLDFNYITRLFIKDDKDLLTKTQELFPNHIIRLPDSDLVAEDIVKSYGGSVPVNPIGIIQLR